MKNDTLNNLMELDNELDALYNKITENRKYFKEALENYNKNLNRQTACILNNAIENIERLVEDDLFNNEDDAASVVIKDKSYTCSYELRDYLRN